MSMPLTPEHPSREWLVAREVENRRTRPTRAAKAAAKRSELAAQGAIDAGTGQPFTADVQNREAISGRVEPGALGTSDNLPLEVVLRTAKAERDAIKETRARA